MKRTLHTTLLLALVLLPLSCRREPPVGTEAFRLEFPLPEDRKQLERYALDVKKPEKASKIQ